jgi:NAD(P)-dependent dehydrogenase (short-subunit alcohol dehydrogenase family)
MTMKIDLTGKTAIVSGSTAGIGLAAAEGLAAAGARVIINGRKQESVEEAAEKIEGAAPGARVTGFAADLGSAEGCDALVKAHPACDILVNNLGIYGGLDFYDTPDSVWTKYFEVNVMSGVRFSRAYSPGMVDKGWGRIVFLGSESAFNIPADMIHYGFTKTACVSIARGLAKRLAGTGVTVNSVLPGPTLSDGLIKALKPVAAEKGQTIEEAAVDFVLANRPSSLIRRASTVEEVANMIVYTCSPQASATTGAALRVDGGVVDSLL